MYLFIQCIYECMHIYVHHKVDYYTLTSWQAECQNMLFHLKWQNQIHVR